MKEIINFSSWNKYDGFAEGSGRSEKIWLKSKEGKIGLFKFPKINNPETNQETTEHVSEHLAYKLGELLGVKTANVDIGTYDGRIGSMSYLICDDKEFLMEGIWFISAKFPKYNSDTMQDEESGKYYCIEHLSAAIPSFIPNKFWIEMMLFDFVTGNRDRHQNNWAILVKKQDNSINIKWSPLYDNGSSLCCYINESDIPALLGKDKVRFNALADSKSRSLIRIDGNKKSMPTHREVVEYLLKNYSVTKEIAKKFLEQLTERNINALLNEYSENILTIERKELICLFLNKKAEILEFLLKEV